MGSYKSKITWIETKIVEVLYYRINRTFALWVADKFQIPY